MDLAYIANGYVYHTNYDTPAAVTPGSIQRAGDNILALVKSIVNSPFLADPGEYRHGSMVFFDFLGIFVVHCPERIGLVINLTSAFVAVLCLIKKFLHFPAKRTIFEEEHFVKYDWVIFGTGKVLRLSSGIGDLIIFLFILLLSWIVGTSFSVAVGVLLTYSGHSLTWYCRPYLLLALYTAPSLLGIGLVHFLIKKSIVAKEKAVSEKKEDNIPLKERISNQLAKKEVETFYAAFLVWTIIMLIMSYYRLASAHLPLLFIIFPLIIRVVIWDNVLTSKTSHENIGAFLFMYLLATLVPVQFCMYLTFAIFDLFVPIMGQSGTQTPPEVFISVLCAFGVVLLTSYMVSIVYVLGNLKLPAIFLLFVTTVGMVISFSGLSFPYSAINQCPKRVFFQHTSRTFYNNAGEVVQQDAVPPHLNPELKNLSVPLNSTFETDCFKRADPPVSVNWTKDGKSLGNNNTLVIKRVTFDDEGLYECAAKNPFGKDNTSFWIDVTVSPQILLSPINQSVTDGDPVNFTCRATGVPTPNLTWTFNGGKLPFGINQNNYEGDSFLESFLEMQNITKEMEGTYKCTAENKANRISYSTTLRVFEKPTAKVSPEPYPTLIQGDKLRLTCSVNEATVNITWRKDGDPIKERAVIDTQLDETTSYLVVEKVVEEDSGEYSCEARNRLGNVARSIVMIKVNPVSPFLVWYYIFGSMAALIVILLMCCYFWKRRRTEFSPNQGEAVEMELLNVEVDEWEIEGNRVLLQEVIGRGAFGAVWRALLIPPNGRPGNRTVAAKCFTPTAGEEGRKCLMREIELGKILGESNQPNIVKFIGCVTRQVHPMLIMEHLPCGDLLGYMRKCRGINDRYYLGEGRAQNLNNYDLVLFARQIAAGMVFLGSRGIIHRDLAARNVLLDNNYVCKVTDFGMAYQNFKYGHGNAKKGCLPIKWTAPEILLGNFAELSTLSDVWSYGIVLYEIVTLGGIPYEGWSEGNVVARVTHGYKLPKPDHVDNKLYAIMKRCWNFDPDFRPPFESLRKRMDTYLREEGVTEPIKRILNSHNVKVAQKPFQTLEYIFAKPKDPVTKEQRTDAIYSIPCND